MSKTLCPFIKKTCMEHDCMLYTHVTFTSPQTGVGEDKYGCALAWIPIMLIENARKTGGVQAAVETMRNDVCTRQDTFNKLVESAQKRTLIKGD